MFRTIVKVSPFSFNSGTIKVNSRSHQVELLSTLGNHYDPWIVNETLDHVVPTGTGESTFADDKAVWERMQTYFKRFHESKAVRMTLLLVGCSGAGKSYTLFGGCWYEHRGIIPRYIEFLYANDTHQSVTTQVQLSMCLLYREDIIDILDPPKYYQHRGHVFSSTVLGPSVMPLRVICATSAEYLMNQIAAGLSTSAVLLANCSEMASVAHLVITMRVFSPSLETMRTVEFVEIAGLLFEQINHTSSVYDSVVQHGSSSGDNYSRDPFVGASLRDYSANVFFKSFERSKEEDGAGNDDVSQKLEGEDDGGAGIDIDDLEQSNEGDVKPLTVDFGSCLLLHMLKDSFALDNHCLAIGCLRGNRSCNKENAECLEFLTKLEEYYTSRREAAEDTPNVAASAGIRTLDVIHIVENCKLEIEKLDAKSDAERSKINDALDKMRKNSMIFGGSKSASKGTPNQETDLLILNCEAKIHNYATQSFFLTQYIDRIQVMRQFAEDTRAAAAAAAAARAAEVQSSPPKSTSTSPGKGSPPKKSSKAEMMKAKLEYDIAQGIDDGTKISSLDSVEIPFLDPYGVLEPVPLPGITPQSATDAKAKARAAKAEATLIVSSPNKTAGSLHEINDTPQKPLHVDEDINSLLPPSYVLEGLLPELPWQHMTDDHNMKLPYLVHLSPCNNSCQFARTTIKHGYTVLRRTQESHLHLSEYNVSTPATAAPEKAADDDDLSLGAQSHQNGTPAGTTAASVSSATVSTNRINNLAALRNVTQKKEQQQYEEQIKELINEGVIPLEVFDAMVEQSMADSTTAGGGGGSVKRPTSKSGRGNPSTKSGKNSHLFSNGESVKSPTEGSTLLDMEESIQSVLFHIDASNPDLDLFEGLSIFGVIIRKLDTVELLPARAVVHKDKYKKVRKTPMTRPMFKVNGVSIDNTLSDRLELYDKDIIQIGTSRWVQIRIPSSNPAHKTHYFPIVEEKPETVNDSSYAGRKIDGEQCSILSYFSHSMILSQITPWEHAVYLSQSQELRNGVVFQFLKKRNEVAHYSVSRELNAIAKVVERSRLMKLKSFAPEWSEVDEFMRLIPIYDQFKIAECMMRTKYATLLANEIRRPLVFACVLRPPLSWKTSHEIKNYSTAAAGGMPAPAPHSTGPSASPAPDAVELEYISADKFRRVFKTYRELLSVLCYETAKLSEGGCDVSHPEDVEQQALSNTTAGAWLWNPDITLSRLHFMRDMFADFSDELEGRRNLSVLEMLYNETSDAFVPGNLADELVGVGFLCIDRLEYLLDLDDYVSIVGFNGFSMGRIKLTLRSWLDEIETVPAYITSDIEANISKSMNHKLIINFYFEHIAGLNPNLCADSYISFKFLGHTSIYRTPRCMGCSTHPFINATVQVVKPITANLVDFIRTGSLEFKVFACRRPSVNYSTPCIRNPVAMRVQTTMEDTETLAGGESFKMVHSPSLGSSLMRTSSSLSNMGSPPSSMLSKSVSFQQTSPVPSGKMAKVSSFHGDATAAGGGGGAPGLKSALDAKSRKLAQTQKLAEALQIEKRELEERMLLLEKQNEELQKKNDALEDLRKPNRSGQGLALVPQKNVASKTCIIQ